MNVDRNSFENQHLQPNPAVTRRLKQESVCSVRSAHDSAQDLSSSNNDLRYRSRASTLKPEESSAYASLTSKGDKLQKWWVFEIFAVIASIACFGSMVAVLALSDNKKQSRWLFGYLTLNGLIALLSTLMRATLMAPVATALGQLKWNEFTSGRGRPRRLADFSTFDQASRGPWGSLKLLVWKARLHLGLIGAIITILTLAFDAFSQQIIVLDSRSVANVNGTSIGQISRSEIFGGVSHTGEETTLLPDLSVKAALYSGLYDTNTVTAPAAHCSTGNCTWPVVPSLAVCGACTDITKDVTFKCAVPSPKSWACNYTIPGGGHDMPGGESFEFSSSYGSTGGPNENSPALLVQPYVTAQYNDSRVKYLEQFIQAEIPYNRTSAVQVRACGLWFCVQAYNTTTRNGVQVQETIGSSSETNVIGEYSPELDFDTTWNFTNIPDSFNVRPDMVFGVSGWSVTSFWQSRGFINSTVYYGADIDSLEYSGPSGEDVGRALYGVTDWDYWIKKVALSLTTSIRSGGTINSTDGNYYGDVYSSQVFVGVRWAWIAFPSAMLLASILFVLAIAWQTHHRMVCPWKSDVLPLLLCSVDEDIKEKYNDGESVKDERVELLYVEKTGYFQHAARESDATLQLSE